MTTAVLETEPEAATTLPDTVKAPEPDNEVGDTLTVTLSSFAVLAVAGISQILPPRLSV